MEEAPGYEAHIPSSPTASFHLEDAAISHDDHHDQKKASQNVSSFFRSVEEGNLQLLNILLKKATIDVNAYNDQGMTALHLSVYKFESRRKLDVIECLLDQGRADPCLKAALMPSQGISKKLSIVRRYDAKSYSDAASPFLETKKISLDRKTPLLLALELKSVLYLRDGYSIQIEGMLVELNLSIHAPGVVGNHAIFNCRLGVPTLGCSVEVAGRSYLEENGKEGSSCACSRHKKFCDKRME